MGRNSGAYDSVVEASVLTVAIGWKAWDTTTLVQKWDGTLRTADRKVEHRLRRGWFDQRPFRGTVLGERHGRARRTLAQRHAYGNTDQHADTAADDAQHQPVRKKDSHHAARSGAESLEKLSDTEFKASVALKIGPVRVKLAGAVTLSDLDPPNGYTISGQGSGAAPRDR